MIVAAENRTIQTGYPVKNETTGNLIRTLIISKPDFNFTSEANFEDKDQWITEIKAENLFPINKVTEVENSSEENAYIKSELDYEYSGKPGRYSYNFLMPYKKEYHDNLAGWNGQDIRIFLADVNNNIIAYKSGTSVLGLDVELFHVEKKGFGANEPGWTKIRLVLSEPTEYNLLTCMDWSVRFNLNFVTLSDISGSGNYVDFTIKDSVYDIEINNLYIDDVSITDNAGGIDVLVLTEKGCGEYRITATGSLTIGTITIDSDRFYGSGEYIIVQSEVVFDNYSWQSDTNFYVDVLLSGDLTPYSGLLLADFTMVDDTYGAVTITNVTESPSGTYEITTSTNLTTGSIDVDDGSVTGSDNYELDLEVEFYDWVDSGSYRLRFKVKGSVSGSPITGLVIDNFAVTDDNHGVLTKSSFTDYGSGEYGFNVTPGRTLGSIELQDEDGYYGDGSYDWVQASVFNGGASDTTDWVDDDTAGLGDGWSKRSASIGTWTILSGITGFTGNLQSIEQTAAGSLGVGIRQTLPYFITGIDYKLRFKYRTIGAGTGSDRFVRVSIDENAGSVINDSTIEPSIGDYSLYESDTFQLSSNTSQLLMELSFAKYGMTLYIDEIELIEV